MKIKGKKIKGGFEGEFELKEGGGSIFRILSCPECDERFLLRIFVDLATSAAAHRAITDNIIDTLKAKRSITKEEVLDITAGVKGNEEIIDKEAQKGLVGGFIEKIEQGDCRDCVHFAIPEYEGIVGQKEAAFCGEDDLGEFEDDEEKYPQHTWTLEEVQKGVNKHTWLSIEVLKEAGIKDLKCIEFLDKAEFRERRERFENQCNWCKKDLRTQATRWDLVCESSEKLTPKPYTRDFDLSSGRHIVAWVMPRGVALQAFGTDFVFIIECCSEKCVRKLEKELERDKHIKKIIKVMEVEQKN